MQPEVDNPKSQKAWYWWGMPKTVIKRENKD